MKCKTILSLAALLICFYQFGCSREPGAVPAEKLTKEQFMALPPETVINFKGERMTKADFLHRRSVESEQARKRLEEMKANAQKEAEARRAAFLREEQAKLEEADKKVQAEIDRLVVADNGSHGADWQERKRQAVKLLDEASKLEQKAGELLAPENLQR